MDVIQSKFQRWWRCTIGKESHPKPCSSLPSSSSTSLSWYGLEEFNPNAVESHESSSASSSYTSAKYDVFLSFSGRDTRATFTGHLYHALVQSGFQIFMDEGERRKEETIDKSIAKSRISIAIFSKHYASSEWCLNELVKIMESRDTNGQTVLPIFYHVDPLDIQKQTGYFGQQFLQLAKISDNGTVERWKEALRKAGTLSGWYIDNGDESKLIQSIVKNIWCELRETTIDAPEILVGISSHTINLLNILNLESEDVKIVGIYGMGGIGKTTIAEAIFNEIHQIFEGSIFLEDVREASKQHRGLLCLQKQILSAFVKQEIQLISNVGEGKSVIIERLHNKKVLICLDDVDELEQLEHLAGGLDWFGPGSRVIITTRDKHLLEVHTVHTIYEVKELDFHQSFHLFNKHAFGKDQPPEDLMKLAEDIIHIAGGLPLALKVLSHYLSDKSPPSWRSALDRMKKIPHNNILEKLRISYDGLDNANKEIFLGIACFFIGTDKEYATDILEGCGFPADVGIENLIQKSLVKIGDHNELRMHDQLRDMGRHIVRQESPREPWMRSRLWSHEEVLDILKRRKGTRNVKGLVLEFEEAETALEKNHFSTEEFEAMSNLRLLKIDNAHLVGDFEMFPSGLKWLSWKGCPLEFIPTDFHLEKLVVLDLSYSRIKQVWESKHQNKQLRQLKVLILRRCEQLTKTPNFSRLPNLEKLNLEGCIKLKELPGSICNLKSFKTLILSGCSNLNKVAEFHGSLQELEVIKLDDCKSLRSLPDCISNMRNLKTLSLDGTSITELPDDVGLLENIRTLSVNRCLNLVKLPASISPLSHLTHLCFKKCNKLQYLPEMPSSLVTLDVESCISLESTSDLSNLKWLLALNLSNCEKLAEIQGIKEMESLKQLWISGCSRSLVNHVIGQGLLQRLHFCTFSGSKIPNWFTRMKISYDPGFVGSREYEVRLDCEIPARLRNHERHQKIIGVALCFVFTNLAVESTIKITVQIKKNGRLASIGSDHIKDIIPSKRYRDQILLIHFEVDVYNFVLELKEGTEISFVILIAPTQEVEVKKAEMCVVYEDTKQLAFERIGDFIAHLSHDDDDDDVDGGEVTVKKGGMHERIEDLLWLVS